MKHIGQKLLGLAMLAITAFVVWLTSEGTIALITVPLALGLIFSKHYVLVI